jgi:hypothetical protein
MGSSVNTGDSKTMPENVMPMNVMLRPAMLAISDVRGMYFARMFANGAVTTCITPT